MKKIILFSPNGYIGGFVKKRIQENEDVLLHVMTRDSNPEQYQEDYDILIYSASITSARHETAEKYVQDNVVTAVKIVDFCKVHHIKKIIYLSSDEIYGELHADMVTAKTIMVNPNLYAITKCLAEKIVMESGIAYYILRLPGVVGRKWGETFIYRLMSEIRDHKQIELYNLDRKFNNILHIDDLTRFIEILCNCEDKNKNEIFLLGNTEKIELEKIVFYMKKLYHSNSRIINIGAVDKRYFTLDVTKAVEYGYSSKNIFTIIDELYRIQG